MRAVKVYKVQANSGTQHPLEITYASRDGQWFCRTTRYTMRGNSTGPWHKMDDAPNQETLDNARPTHERIRLPR